MGYLRTFDSEISLLSTTAELRKDDNQFRRHLQVRLGGGLQCQALCTDDGIGGSNGAAFFNRPAELIHSTQYRVATGRKMLTYYLCTRRLLVGIRLVLRRMSRVQQTDARQRSKESAAIIGCGGAPRP